MRRSQYTVITLVCVVSLLTASTASLETFPVHRALQYTHDGSSYGSQTSTFGMVVRSLSQAKEEGLSTASPVGSSRFACVLPVEELIERNEQFLTALQEAERENIILSTEERNNLFARHISHGAKGLLVMLPEGQMAPRLIPGWNRLEEQMAIQSILIPIYFTRSSTSLKPLLASEEGDGNYPAILRPLLADNFHLAVHQTPASAVKDATPSFIFSGWVRPSGNTAQLPTVVIHAPLDASSAVPSLASGNSATVAAMLELMRVMKAAAGDSRIAPPYNLLFLLSTGELFDHHAVTSWLAEQSPRTLRSIEAVICLDSLLAPDANSADGFAPLSLHGFRRREKDTQTARLYHAFESAAKGYGTGAHVVDIQKINLNAAHHFHPHEVFAKERVLSVTIAAANSFTPAHENAPLLFKPRSDSALESIDSEALQKRVQQVADTLFLYMVHLPEGFAAQDIVGEIFSDIAPQTAISPLILLKWTEILSSGPRMSHLLQQTDSGIVAVRKWMESHLEDVAESAYVVASASTPPRRRRQDAQTPTIPRKTHLHVDGKATMSLYASKPILFDIVVGLCIAAFLAGLHFLFQALEL